MGIMDDKLFRLLFELLYVKGVLDETEYHHIIDTIEFGTEITPTLIAIRDVIDHSNNNR